MSPLSHPSTAIALTALACALAACGASQTASSPSARVSQSAVAASPSVSATSSPAQLPTTRYVAVVTQGSTQHVELVDLSGHVVATSAAVLDGNVVVGIGERGVYLQRSPGSITVFGPMAAETAAVTLPQVRSDSDVAVVDSPDGATLFATVTDFDQAGENATTRFFTAAVGATPRLVTTLSRPNNPSGGYRALRWDLDGVVLGSVQTGVGGNGPFIGEGYEDKAVEVMDPQTGAVMPIPASCVGWRDQAEDGTLACLSADDTAISIVRPSGTSISVGGHPSDRFGMLTFVGGSSHLLYGADTIDSQSQNWTYTLHDVDLTASPPSDRVVKATLDASLEDPLWKGLAGPGTVAISTQEPGPGVIDVALLDLSAGSTRMLVSDALLVGVVHSLG